MMRIFALVRCVHVRLVLVRVELLLQDESNQRRSGHRRGRLGAVRREVPAAQHHWRAPVHSHGERFGAHGHRLARPPAQNPGTAS